MDTELKGILVTEKDLIVFDHECVFCSGFVRFVFSRDPQYRFNFTAAQSELGQRLYRENGLNTSDFSTNLVFVDGKLYTKMAAFIKVMEVLGRPYSALTFTRFIPVSISNWIYDRIARNRYRIWGRYETCMIPSKELKERVID